jgi:hypothetical protein
VKELKRSDRTAMDRWCSAAVSAGRSGTRADNRSTLWDPQSGPARLNSVYLFCTDRGSEEQREE